MENGMVYLINMWLVYIHGLIQTNWELEVGISEHTKQNRKNY